MGKQFVNLPLTLDPQRIASRLLQPHAGLLAKLRKLSKCRTRKQVDALQVDRAQLQALLAGVAHRDRRGQQVVCRIRDCDLAKLLGLTQ